MGSCLRAFHLWREIGYGKMDIAKHLARHAEILRALAFKYGRYDKDLREDCYQAGVLALIAIHKGPYKHNRGTTLLTYAWDKVNEVMVDQVKLVRTEFRYGITEELDELQEMAEDQSKDRLRLETLYDEPIEGIRPIAGSSLALEDEELALKVRAALSDDDLRLLEASYGRSNYSAARALGLPESTYRFRLERALRRAKGLAS